jgi:hypothetical protein
MGSLLQRSSLVFRTPRLVPVARFRDDLHLVGCFRQIQIRGAVPRVGAVGAAIRVEDEGEGSVTLHYLLPCKQGHGPEWELLIVVSVP